MRNSCRHHFWTADEITSAAQQEWFSRLTPLDEYYVIYQEGQTVGFFGLISTKPDLPVMPTKCVWGHKYFSSIMVAEHKRGQGIIQAAKMKMHPAYAYVAYTQNAASAKACLKLGFTERGIFTHPTIGELVVLQLR